MELWRISLQIVLMALEILTGFLGVYQIVMSLAGFWHRRESVRHSPRKRFLFLIPAHNEERVIGLLIDSLHTQNYPKDLFDIHVIADNCTDHTVQVAEKHGARVHRRTNTELCGKGFAIEWAIREIFQTFDRHDAIVLLDADNLVAPDFLERINSKLCEGHRVIQGYLDVKNPFDSWVSVSMAVSYWFSNRMWQNARQNLGLSCSLGGTGLCIDTSVLMEIGWEATGLTEDLEFGVRCVRRGILPVWAHDAKVYDEKPVDLRSSMRQRLRWMQGHFDCAKKHMLPLLISGIRERNFAKVDAAIYLFQPTRFIVLFLTSLMMVFQVSALQDTPWSKSLSFLPTNFWVFINLFLYLQVPLALLLERVNWRAYFGVVLLPWFLWTWGPITLQAYFTKNNRVWRHTVHKRAIRLDDLRGR